MDFHFFRYTPPSFCAPATLCLLLLCFLQRLWCILLRCADRIETRAHGEAARERGCYACVSFKKHKSCSQRVRVVCCFCARLLKVLGMGWVGLGWVVFRLCICMCEQAALVSNQVGEFNQLIRTELIRRCAVLALYSIRESARAKERTHFAFVQFSRSL